MNEPLARRLRAARALVGRHAVVFGGYGVVAACAIAAPLIDVHMDARIAPLRAELAAKRADLERLTSLPPRELPTPALLAWQRGRLAGFAAEEDAIDATYERIDRPLAAPITESDEVAFFATAYEATRKALVERHRDQLPRVLPRCLEPVEIRRDADRDDLGKRLLIGESLLDACAAAEVDRVTDMVQRDPVAMAEVGGVGLVERPVILIVELRLARLPELLRRLLRDPVPMRIAAVELTKLPFGPDELYRGETAEARDTRTRFPLRAGPNAGERRPWYDDLIYVVDIPQEEWDEAHQRRWLPEPPVRASITVHALDFDVR